jgi:hypothetical protein
MTSRVGIFGLAIGLAAIFSTAAFAQNAPTVKCDTNQSGVGSLSAQIGSVFDQRLQCTVTCRWANQVVAPATLKFENHTFAIGVKPKATGFGWAVVSDKNITIDSKTPTYFSCATIGE